MRDQRDRWTRIRYTAVGAATALAAVGAIAGSVALASGPQAAHSRAATTATGAVTKTRTAPLPTKTERSEANPNSGEPFLSAVALLVSDGTITAAEARVLAAEIQAGGVDPEALAASGFGQQQLQAVQQALSGVKESMATAALNRRTGTGTQAKNSAP